MAFCPFKAHQRICGHFHGCPFCTEKWDQTGPINISAGTFSRTIPINGFGSGSLLSPSTYLRAFSWMPILDWEMGPNWYRQRIYEHIFMHYPKIWPWVPFKPINVSTSIFTDAHSGLGNGTKQVPSTYLRAYFHTLSRNMALGPVSYTHLTLPTNREV